jgi:formate hydrogenlyase subunit 3/multisubunit Na+/H+ antiporter MnhD subunit
VLVVLIGVTAGPIFDIAHATAAELLEPSAYLQAVLGPET